MGRGSLRDQGEESEARFEIVFASRSPPRRVHVLSGRVFKFCVSCIWEVCSVQCVVHTGCIAPLSVK